MSLYRKLLVQAWKNTWHHKYLWFFGLFAAIIGTSGELNLLFSGLDNPTESGFLPSLKAFWSTGIFSGRAVANFGDLMINDSYNLLVALTVLAVLFLLFCFLIWFSVVCQAGLVNNYSRIVANKSHDFKAGIDAGTKKFWPVFGLNIILKVIIYIIYLLLALPVIFLYAKFSAWQFFIFTVTYLIFIPLSIVVAFIIKYATVYVVVKGEKLVEALRLGWELFLKNWLVSIEMAFILFGISFVVTFCLFLCLIILAIPLLFFIFLLPYLTGGINVGLIIFCAFCTLVLGLLIIIVVGSWLSAFMIASWTGLFLELISRGGVSKLVRIFSQK
ncbi:MAG: hypothetical protein NTW06_03055 [Candidatus Falkowbacteria bacterium]|nr:hypothetical protein [Candidatus Falkowbacteria bacterium]